jgi:hypothetical protein
MAVRGKAGQLLLQLLSRRQLQTVTQPCDQVTSVTQRTAEHKAPIVQTIAPQARRYIQTRCP